MPAFSLDYLMFHTKFKMFLPDSLNRPGGILYFIQFPVFLVIQMSLDNTNLHSQHLSKSL